jgi:hypothetical protein
MQISCKYSKIIWAKASIKNGKLVIVPIYKEKHITELNTKPTITNKFVAVSRIGDSIKKTCEYKRHVHSHPNGDHPLFSDSTPQQAAQIMWERGDEPIWGPIMYIKRLAPRKAFQGRIHKSSM